MSIQRRASLAALLIVGVATRMSALELGVDAIASNLQFPWEDSAPIADSTFPKDNYFWGGAAWLRTPLGEDAAIRLSVERDPVLRNSAFAEVEFERGIAKIAAGPFFGFLNTDSAPFSAGISATVKLQWPGVAYVSMRSDGATAISLFQTDAAPQARTEIKAGLYVPHAIVSAIVSAKRFNETLASGDLITDSLTRYAMEIEVFKKNVPYTLVASLGYEQRSKRFEASDATDTLGAVVVGVETAARIGPALDITTSFSTGAYVFGLDELAGRGPSGSDLFFTAGIGFALDVSAIPPRPPRIEEPAVEETEPVAEEVQVEEGQAEAEPAPEEETEAEAAPREKPGISQRLGLSAGAGIGYERFIYLPSGFFLYETLLNLRGNAWIGASYKLVPLVSLGAEAGVDYITFTESTSGVSLNIVDIPLRLVVGFDFGLAKVDAFGGFMPHGFYVAEPSSWLLYYGIEAGARLRMGLFYLEGSYVFGLGDSLDLGDYGLDIGLNSNFFRFGTGVSFKLK